MWLAGIRAIKKSNTKDTKYVCQQQTHKHTHTSAQTRNHIVHSINKMSAATAASPTPPLPNKSRGRICFFSYTHTDTQTHARYIIAYKTCENSVSRVLRKIQILGLDNPRMCDRFKMNGKQRKVKRRAAQKTQKQSRNQRKKEQSTGDASDARALNIVLYLYFKMYNMNGQSKRNEAQKK